MEIYRLRERAEKQGLKTRTNHRDEMSNLWGHIPVEERNKKMAQAIKSFRDDIINGE